MAAEHSALVDFAKTEALKAAPLGGSLIFYGMTLQQWTIVFGCMYALGLLLDLVVRRWLGPLIKYALERRAKRAEERGGVGS
ncbi:hypothetical protein ACDX36_26365 [Pseudomonas aeruginosa]|jgi:hypothetical protein|uniref:hypothetical protein n=1 Tax=Pseudomonas aeruginosa TaxID=287 RepID=UPI001AE08C41|nr:hypothetical protein [Pseudomonas aeruginosa]MDF1652623.1 hypothetical protein [Pseudomonas aeruginosa]